MRKPPPPANHRQVKAVTISPDNEPPIGPSPAPEPDAATGAQDGRGSQPFVLAGSITINVSDEELERDLAANRAEQNALFEAKLRRFAE
jgi:hypothetical protein